MFRSCVSWLLIATFSLCPCVEAFALSFFTSVDERAVIMRGKEFDRFLNSCSSLERIQLMQSLEFFDTDLKDGYFSRLKALPALSYFSADKDSATPEHPARPKTFNEVMPETVLDAMEKGVLNRNGLSVREIKKQLVWKTHNRLTYMFRDVEDIDYHEIVQDIAKELGVDSNSVKNLRTYDLERKITEAFLAKLWDDLKPEQREAVLRELMKENKELASKSSIAELTKLNGKRFVIFLAGAKILVGFKLYTFAVGLLHAIGIAFGMTFPFVFYTTLTKTISILVSPWLWVPFLLYEFIHFFSRDENQIAGFIMVVNSIKAQRLER